MKKKKTTRIRILLNSNGQIHKLGDLMLRTYDGDLYYKPSTTRLVGSPSKEIEHFSWHKTGMVLVKMADNVHKILDKDRQKIQTVGYQELFKDLILDYKRLPAFIERKESVDIILNIKSYNGPFILLASIVSGVLLVKKWRGELSLLEMVNQNNSNLLLDVQKRALGYESGNADKIIQFGLFKYNGKLSEFKSKRRIVITHNQKISKDFPS